MARQTTTPRRTFTVTLQAAGTGADADGWQAFRRWLKASWRIYSLKCISLATDPPLAPLPLPGGASAAEQAVAPDEPTQSMTYDK